MAAGYRGIDRNRRTDGQIGNRRADFDHPAGQFMAQHHGILQDRIAGSSFRKIVQIRATDAAIGQRQPHLVGLQRILGSFVEAQVLGAVDYIGTHDLLLMMGQTTDVMPPSTKIFWPETKLEAAEHR